MVVNASKTSSREKVTAEVIDPVYIRLAGGTIFL
jgi:hypothetical protein